MTQAYAHPGVGRFAPLRIEGVVYSCGDVHGRDDLLAEFLDWVGADAHGNQATVVFLGDYVDRGPRSREVVERLMRGPSRPGETWIPLKGNHDALFAAAWRDPDSDAAATWIMNGGMATKRSYGVGYGCDLAQHVPEAHIRFLEGLQLAADDGERLYVHAGVRPGLGIAFQSEQDLTWIRSPFLEERHDVDRLVVHGHTPSKAGPVATRWRLGIDTRAYSSDRLTGVRFEPGVPVPRVWQSGVGLLPEIEGPEVWGPGFEGTATETPWAHPGAHPAPG
ncbi:Bis(5'-nucleosyl)-tetraphosphatase, symmetrical [Methylobacterium hispanicum]|uniref:Bis(5'-nucleosyl)-tetraphosphatase, symmetrical n=2 Tax=Methylobacterium hispanicum TaxID=270350 RepID=A0AAV4ZIP9_9HYPH|nr:Bis(5'-nucleosyl)-tetraphosphatase, symmetrical [Methylobacterium hispanicum]